MRDLIRRDQISATNAPMPPQRIIDIDLTPALGKAKEWLAHIAQLTQIGRVVGNLISKDEIYIVNIPNEIRKGIVSGESWLTRKKGTGELLASVSHEVEGRKQFLANLTIEPTQLVNKEALSQMSDGLYNLAMQQQLAAIAVELAEVHEIVQRIENGQTDDRFGDIDGAIDLLDLALVQSEENQTASIRHAIQSLSIGAGKIKKSLDRKISVFRAVPESEFRKYLMLWKPGDYKASKEKEFNEIKKYFDYYIKAEQALALSYLMLGEIGAVQKLVQKLSDNLTSLDTKKILSIRNIFPQIDFSQEWFFNPHQYVARIEASLDGST